MLGDVTRDDVDNSVRALNTLFPRDTRQFRRVLGQSVVEPRALGLEHRSQMLADLVPGPGFRHALCTSPADKPHPARSAEIGKGRNQRQHTTIALELEGAARALGSFDSLGHFLDTKCINHARVHTGSDRNTKICTRFVNFINFRGKLVISRFPPLRNHVCSGYWLSPASGQAGDKDTIPWRLSPTMLRGWQARSVAHVCNRDICLTCRPRQARPPFLCICHLYV